MCVCRSGAGSASLPTYAGGGAVAAHLPTSVFQDTVFTHNSVVGGVGGAIYALPDPDTTHRVPVLSIMDVRGTYTISKCQFISNLASLVEDTPNNTGN